MLILADWHLPIFDFCEFQECEAQSKASQAKLCIKGRNAEVDMFAEHHVGGRLGVDSGWSVEVRNAVG